MVSDGTPAGSTGVHLGPRSMSRYPLQNGLTGQRTAKREGWGAAGGSSERTFGAPRPLLNPSLTQRDMKREDTPAADPEPSAR